MGLESERVPGFLSITTIISLVGSGPTSYHGDLCQERFSHAETTVDSLTIIQVDNFCFKLIMEQK